MTRHGDKRPGVTLLEVLLAIFILAIGMVSILACFPIASLNMVRAVRDQRSAQVTVNANTLLHQWWKESWYTPDGLIMPEEIVSGQEPTIELLDTEHLSGNNFNILRVDSGPSHPVMIDPLGIASYGPTVGGFIERAHLNKGYPTFGANRRNQLRMTTLPDDMSFDRSANAANSAGQFDRGYRYSCAWVLQREHNSNPYDVRKFTLTFDNRPIDLPDGDQVYIKNPTFNQLRLNDPNSLTIISNTNALPRTRKAGWVMVAYHATYPLGAANFKPPRWVVSFHRTISQDDALVGGLNERTVGLEQAVSTPTSFDDVRVVIFEKLIEVFDGGTMSLADRPW